MRKTETATPPPFCGRDVGKVYVITETTAMAAEKWAWRVTIALKGTSARIPDEVARLGYVGIAVAGLNAFFAADVDPDRLMPLLDEMLDCVKRARDPKTPDVLSPLHPDLEDVEEVATVGWLRSEVIRVHTGFSFAEALSMWTSAIAAAAASLTTPTSPPTSGSPSPADAAPTLN